jgi:chromosome partitioning protein
VGKTTTTISLGAALAARGRRVLLVDLDPQQNLSTSLKAPKKKPSLADVLSTAVLLETAELSDAFVEVCGMTVAGGYELANAENYLSFYKDAEKALKWAIEPQSYQFDFVLMDCGPSMSFFTISALAAADALLVPIQTEFLALSQIPAIMSSVEDVRRRLNPALEIFGFLPTMFDTRTRHSREILEQIAVQARRFGTRGFKPVPKTVRMAEASSSGRPISTYAPSSPAAIAYDDLAGRLERELAPNESPVPEAVSKSSNDYVGQPITANYALKEKVAVVSLDRVEQSALAMADAESTSLW